MVHPAIYVDKLEYARRLITAIDDVTAIVPPGSLIVQIDGAQCGAALAAGRPALPFLEKDGQYWGAPPDDATAIAELERLRRDGARFVVVAWPAFWWLDHYAAFHRHLRATSRAVCENERVVIFHLGD